MLAPPPVVKVIFVGSAGSGKTSLFCRMLGGVFDESQKPTVVVDAKQLEKTIDDTTITLHFFDTAGTEKFRSVALSFFRNAGIVLLCYDISDGASFGQLKEFWVPKAQEQAEDALRFVVGTKSDLTRAVDVSAGEALACANDALFLETSAKMGEGVQELLNSIGKAAKEILDRKHQAETSRVDLEKPGEKKSDCC
jgi:small GTP-binding protein